MFRWRPALRSRETSAVRAIQLSQERIFLGIGAVFQDLVVGGEVGLRRSSRAFSISSSLDHRGAAGIPRPSPTVGSGGAVELRDTAVGFVATIGGEEWDATGDRQTARRMMLLAATAAAAIARGGSAAHSKIAIAAARIRQG
jgi:hypothetical protein